MDRGCIPPPLPRYDTWVLMLRPAFRHRCHRIREQDFGLVSVVYRSPDRLLPAGNGLEPIPPMLQGAVNFIYSPVYQSTFPSAIGIHHHHHPFLPFIRLLFTPFAPFRFLYIYICTCIFSLLLEESVYGRREREILELDAFQESRTNDQVDY